MKIEWRDGIEYVDKRCARMYVGWLNVGDEMHVTRIE